ncbi:MAG: DUF2892 domain-containing protein [Sphingobacteriales bacterium]|nr:DUF2892 domain-containing protein [Sphingobacteriales bacterium]
MKANMGALDKVIRILIAVVIGVLYYLHHLSGLWAIILGILAIIFILTSFMSFCPLYVPFNINTKKNNK